MGSVESNSVDARDSHDGWYIKTRCRLPESSSGNGKAMKDAGRPNTFTPQEWIHLPANVLEPKKRCDDLQHLVALLSALRYAWTRKLNKIPGQPNKVNKIPGQPNKVPRDIKLRRTNETEYWQRGYMYTSGFSP